MPRPPNTDTRRAQIVAGLMQAMASHGYAGATIAKIARAAGLSPGLVHYHFGSKAEILLALVTSLREGLRERVAVDDKADPHERLRAFLDALVATGPGADPHAVAAWVVISAEALRSDEVRAAWRGAIDELLDALGERVEAALVADQAALPEADVAGHARHIAVLLLMHVQGAFQVSAAAPELLAPGSMAEALWAHALALLASAPGHRSSRRGSERGVEDPR